MAKRPNYKKQCDELQRQLAAALAGQQAMQRRLDAANVECEATKNWRARVSADADAANNRHAQERKELQRQLDAARELIHKLEVQAIGLKADLHKAAVLAPPMMPGPASDAARYEAAMHALRATPFGFVACRGIVDAIKAYLNPRSQSDLSAAAAGLLYGRESSPDAAPPRDR